ncbi:Dabb family protein [Verrucomicrobiota bacterium]
MVKHIVMWRMKPEVTQEQIAEMKAQLEGLKGKIDELIDIEVGIDFQRKEASSDVSLYSVFNDEAGLQAYAIHPEHLKVVDFVKPLVAERRVVDYNG